MPKFLRPLRQAWAPSSLGTECTFHQLAPYIGKLKSSIARELICSFSKPDDIIFDPFSGSGVVPLEALSLGRGAIAMDISPYAAVLTRAKMYPPETESLAIDRAAQYIRLAKEIAKSAHYSVSAPNWVRRFFNRRTLAETKALADLLKSKREWFLLASLLGILHHQRPGFLSYPSSHLVPYLRFRKFPRSKFPELYQYRDVEPRLLAKLKRAFRRPITISPHLARRFVRGDARMTTSKQRADLVVTSPPYMNALDYGRDNRIRLWFCGMDNFKHLDSASPNGPVEFYSLLRELGSVLEDLVVPKGQAILVVGEVRRTRYIWRTDRIASDAFTASGNWKLIDQLSDLVPDVRRSRRGCETTKREWVLLFKKRY